MATSPFIWGSGGAKLTPEEIALQRSVLARRKAQGVDVSPIGSPLQGLARVVDALGDRYQEGQLNDAATENATVNKDILASLLGGGSPTAPSSVASSLSSQPVSDASIPQTADAASIRQGLIARGLPEHVADGFLVNFQDESGLNPGINEANPIVPGSRGGFGLYQLTGPRRTAYESFASQKGVDPSNVDAQLDFLKYELEGPEKAAGQSILAAGDTATAAQAIVNNFLRPSQEHRDRRSASYANLSSPSVSPIGQSQTVAVPQVAQAQNIAPTNSLGVSPTVIQALTSPYANEQTKGIAQLLLQQQQGQASQQQKQALAEQQRQQEIARRQAIAQQTGIDPAYAGDDDIWKAAAGNIFAAPSTSTVDGAVIDNRTRDVIYRAPAQTFRQITGQDAAALGLDPSKAYNVGPDNKIAPIGDSGVTVNNNMGGDKFGEEFAKLDAKALDTVATSGQAAQRNIGRINQLGELLKSSPSGFEGAVAQRAGEWGIPTKGLDTLQAAQAAINSLVPEQRQPGSGPMSDSDLALFKQSLPRIINQPGGNDLIINTMKSIAQYDAEGAKIVQQLRNGKIDRAQAFEALQSRPNPLDNFKVPSEAQGDTAPSQQQNGWKDLGNGVKIRPKGSN